VARRPAYDLDTIDSLGREYCPSKLAWDLGDRAPVPSRYIRPVNGPVDLDDLPPILSGADRAKPQHPIRRRPPGKDRYLRSIRSNSKPLRSARPWLTCVAGTLAFAISFVVALRVTKPPRPPTAAMTMLAGSTISNLGSLMAAVKNAGLRGTPDIKGGIDEITRRDKDHVTLKGWAAEISDSDSPLAVMVFVDGRKQVTLETNGRRPDVTAALGLSEAASANVSFQGDLTCSRGQKLIVIAVAQSDAYGHFGTRLCP
jgi:hypothetical protein